MEKKGEIGSEFKPAPQFKRLYNYYAILAFLVGFLWWYILLILLVPNVYLVSLFVIALLLYLFTALIWIPKYYESIFYRLTENEIVWRRGVWFKTTGIVPYNRITNIDITQGPISRNLGIAALKIQTAGYSVQRQTAEIKLEGIENHEELRETIMSYVKGRKPVAVQTFEEEKTEVRVLEELTKIRQLLEKQSNK
jgi:membrane protein YdbS with pleckstrin-like domain